MDNFLNLGTPQSFGIGMGLELQSRLNPGGTSAEVDAGFADLLGLLENLEPSDTQSVGFAEDFESKLLVLEDEAKGSLQNQLNQSQILGLGAAGLGSSGDMEINPSNMQAGHLVTQGEASLDEVGKRIVDQLSNQAEAEIVQHTKVNQKNLSSSAVSEWSQAMANGDLKSVELHQKPLEAGLSVSSLPRMPQEMEEITDAPKTGVPAKPVRSSETSMTQQRVPVGSESVDLKTPETMEQPERTVGTTLPKVDGSLKSTETMEQLERTVGTALPKVEGNLESTERNMEQRSKEHLRVSSSEKQTLSVGLSKDSKKSENIESQTAGNFLLEKQSHESVAASLNPGVSVLKDAGTLGNVEDQRIRPEAIDFVAERVEKLKANGGGFLKVQLEPKELGIVEIRVMKVGSQIQVKLTAERIETQNMFDASKLELAQRLDSIAPGKVQLDVNQSFVAEKAAVNRDSRPAPAPGSTSDFIQMSDPKATRESSVIDLGGVVKDLPRAELRSGISKVDVGSSNQELEGRAETEGKDFQRDRKEEGKERVWEMWEDLISQRKKA